MTLRRATIWISLSAGALALAGCQDLPQGYPHGRDQPSWHAQEFPGQRFEGGLESPNAIRNPRPNEGAIAPKPAPGTGGAGLEQQKNLLDVAAPAPTLSGSPLSSTKSPSALRAPVPPGPSAIPESAYPGGGAYLPNRNNDNFGPAAPIRSGDTARNPRVPRAAERGR